MPPASKKFFLLWSAHKVAAPNILCKTVNFNIGDDAFLRKHLAGLPPLPNGTTRNYILKVRIDNNFEQSLRAKPILLEDTPFYMRLSEAAAAVKFDIVVNFDSESFDIEYLRSYLSRYTVRDHSAVTAALRAAVARYDAEKEEMERARKRRGQRRRVKTKGKR